MGKIKSKLSKKSRSNKPKHRDDTDFESAVSRRPHCMTHESHDPSPISVETIPPSLAQERERERERERELGSTETNERGDHMVKIGQCPHRLHLPR